MKTKVIAFRVTQEEHQLLTELCDDLGNISFSRLFNEAIAEKVSTAKELIERRRKAFERKQKRDAKKAAANGAQ